MSTFSEYEHAEAHKIIERKQQVEARPQNRLERVTQETGQKAIEGVRKLPHADKAMELAGGAYGQAVEGLGKALSATAVLTLSNKRLIRKYARRDSSVLSMADIRNLNLSIIDAVRPRSLSTDQLLEQAQEECSRAQQWLAGRSLLPEAQSSVPALGVAPGMALLRLRLRLTLRPSW